MTPTQRTLKLLRAHGYTVGVTEKWNPHAKIRQDLFGFVDLVAFHPKTGGLLFIQTCAGASHAARKAKIEANETAVAMMKHYQIAIISWSKRGARGKVKKWEPRMEFADGVPIRWVPITMGMAV